MLSLDLFGTKYERELREGAVDDLEARRIDILNDRMQDLLSRAKESRYKNNPAALAGLKKEYQRFKDERDSYYKVREGSVTPTATGLRHQAKPGTYGGYESEPELKGLNKTLTKKLEKGMGIEFKKGGVGNRVQPDMDEGGIPGNVPTEKIPGKEDLLKGKGRSYYESQKKNLNLSKGVIPTEPLPEHGGGIGPKQRWQDLMPEQSNLEQDDWYDDEEDQETDLRSGDYVRDRQDGESGEIFRMQGDPYERRVRILDRDGKGWYIEPSRLTRVDPQDPDIQRYFGKQRQRNMNEGTVNPQFINAQVTKILAGEARRFTNAPMAQLLAPVMKQYGLTLQQIDGMVPGGLRKAAGEYGIMMKEGWSDAVVARRTGSPRTPYSVYIKGKKWKDFENEDHAESVANKLRAKFNAEGRDPSVITIAPTDYDQPVKEDQDTSGVESAIIRRIMVAHTDLLQQFGPEKVMQAAEEVAYNVGDVDEIGTSDVSAYVDQVKQILGATA